MTNSRVETLLAAGVMLAAFAGTAAALQPSQADIEACNRMAAVASIRTAKGSHEPNQQPRTAQRDAAGGHQRDSSGSGSTPDAIGMAPVGETDGVYRQAYTSCMNQRAR